MNDKLSNMITQMLTHIMNKLITTYIQKLKVIRSLNGNACYIGFYV